MKFVFGFLLLYSLHTDTLQQSFELAIILARIGIGYAQTSAELRPITQKVLAALTIASHAVATHFQTVAAANNYWK